MPVVASGHMQDGKMSEGLNGAVRGLLGSPIIPMSSTRFDSVDAKQDSNKMHVLANPSEQVVDGLVSTGLLTMLQQK